MYTTLYHYGLLLMLFSSAHPVLPMKRESDDTLEQGAKKELKYRMSALKLSEASEKYSKNCTLPGVSAAQQAVSSLDLTEKKIEGVLNSPSQEHQKQAETLKKREEILALWEPEGEKKN